MPSNDLKSSVVMVEYSDTYDEHLFNYQIPEEQLQFTSMPLDKIKNSNVSSSAKHVLILEYSVPVGYFALDEGEKLLKYSNNSEVLSDSFLY